MTPTLSDWCAHSHHDECKWGVCPCECHKHVSES